MRAILVHSINVDNMAEASPKEAKVRKARHHTGHHGLVSFQYQTHPILKRKASRRTTALGGDRCGEKGEGSKAVHGLCLVVSFAVVDNNDSSAGRTGRPTGRAERFHGIALYVRTVRGAGLGPVLRSFNYFDRETARPMMNE